MTKPIIGINCDIDISNPDKTRLFLYTDYFDAIRLAGGIPLFVPFGEDAEETKALLQKVDGLLLTGGDDIDPSLYGQEPFEANTFAGERRILFDQRLVKGAIDSDLPVMGICMGLQMLNIVAGGTLCQDLKTLRPSAIEHQQPEKARCEVHKVSIAPDSYLAEIVGVEPLGVNSTHHQAIEGLAPPFSVAARSVEDDVIEAIEMPGAPRIFAVQWHPERLTAHTRHLALFRALVRLASGRGNE